VETLITPAELPRFVPGDLLHCSDGLGWKDLSLRTYRYRALDVAVPALADFAIVSYRRGRTPIERRFEGKWTRTDCAPGDISLLSRCQPSHWHWTYEIDVTHAYLSEAIVSRVAADVLGRPVAEVRLRDLLRAQDPMVTMLVEAISREAGHAALGGALYVEALSTQLVVHLLRHHATIAFRDESQSGRLSAPLRQRLIEYVEVHLEQPLTLEELANVAGIGVWSFGKRFRASFETTPHHYVIERRVERARQLLTRGQLPLKAVACACGFSDQAHMTRVMRARLGTTPAALRRDACT
jgi:AraC family transcriptional regulator